MANNYMQFSTCFPLADENQAKEAMEIARKVAIDYLVANEGEEKEDFTDNTTDFNGTSVELDGKDLWIYGEEYGNPDLVESVVKALQEHFKIDEPFYLSWAFTCSKMRLDEFGGGAMCVRRGKETLYIDALNHVRDMAEHAAD